ncbi:SRPBCC family protein [Nonomuraea rhodomycinica]|uniref:SRPBCC family protein n=1 Tax=Nonomuraea rhodomycinica TaxID=1712872 RepID=A0A7Y6IQL1_9ACTN|nr:SRPBCC family protein [Nonomuraea rhodomycinica]NUW41274.1 SRPBCC family protein [Nonomuraea rhodomycinica]
MITVEHVAAYPAAPEAVFAVLADLERHPDWQADVLSAHVDGPVRQDATVTQVRKVMGKRAEITLTVAELVPGERLVLRTAPGTRPGVTQRYTVTADGPGSRVEFRLELDGVPKLAEHLVRAQLGKQVPLLFDRLGALVAAR